ncbi:MAG: S-methyl-5'-thioadenosine phosphorylase [Chloroflexi bacterium HGW-Chloroflexi-4]|jgi:5'-methylthioadenosine phosphorylase|nr:MAG: S-methyl-5'-thioadenosine phosphorylase [Chloroflexi bacterium HGW-Chloroflexi-4]
MIMDNKPVLAVIGGSGLYDFAGLTNIEKIEPETPFGRPSAPIVVGSLAGKRVAFLARHGLGHTLSPTEVNYRANIYALKSIGVERIISVSACGSLREDFAPGHIVIPSQLFDLTNQRNRSFFGEGLVVHVGVADPFCVNLSTTLYNVVSSTGTTTHMGGSLITIEGPRFSTKAESNTYQAWGMSLVGMTASPEAFLAREAEICYAVMAHVTDYDVWHQSEESVSVDMVIKTLHKNTEIAQKTITTLVGQLADSEPCSCQNALENAIITRHDAIPAETKKKLGLLVKKYL